MLKLKVCGMRDPQNISDLIVLNPDFIGFIFHEESTRNCSIEPSIKIPSTIKKVGVFVNKPLAFILDKIELFKLDFIQLHGNETAHFCETLHSKGVQVIKAFNIHADFDFTQLEFFKESCSCFLFDAFGEKPGGNGVVFNWQLLQKYSGNIPFLLSGGINETMVKNIKKITHKQFMGVDVNSGFETEPALKNILKIKQFQNELRS